MYMPQKWYDEAHEERREKCALPEGMQFETKNQIVLRILNTAIDSGRFDARRIGCDAAYRSDNAFLDGLKLPEDTWYFAATSAKKQVFLEKPDMIWPEKKRDRPATHAIASLAPVSVKSVACDESILWKKIALTEGSKGTIFANIKKIHCIACRDDGSRNYIKPGPEIWLYLRKYEDGTIKYFVSNAPQGISEAELNRAATLRWLIEQCFEECKGYLGMSHYECRSYGAWMGQMLFVMIAQLFISSLQLSLKKTVSLGG